MTISILTTAPCGCSVKEGTSLVLVCAQVIDWVRFPTAAHPEPCNSNPIRCLERNNQPNRLSNKTSLAEESAKIIDVFEKAVTNLKEVASRAQAEKEVREQEIIELQTEAANLEAVSNKATAMTEKIGGLLS